MQLCRLDCAGVGTRFVGCSFIIINTYLTKVPAGFGFIISLGGLLICYPVPCTSTGQGMDPVIRGRR